MTINQLKEKLKAASLNPKQQETLRMVVEALDGKTILTRQELHDVIISCEDRPVKGSRWLYNAFRIEHGRFELPTIEQLSENPIISQKVVKGEVSTAATSEVESMIEDVISFIPEVDANYVRWGNSKDVESIIKSEIFYPTFITGLSGNGKTFMVEQTCAKLQREMIRVNVTIETDEDDLLGGFRLVDGQTVFHKGPVVEAMERGAVLLLDEVDLASNKILCLQPVLEGKGVYLKKINQWIKPTDGFNIVATANTKGKGSESGAFVGTNILNEAFLERFAVTIEQSYAPTATEVKILSGEFERHGVNDDNFVNHLVRWAEVIRKTYYDGGIDEIISTRRLVHIAKAYAIFDNREKAVGMCINRFDDDTKESFKDLYDKIDGDDLLVAEDNLENRQTLAADISHMVDVEDYENQRSDMVL